MLIDLAVNPFEADVGWMVEMAVVAEERGYAAVWVADHFSGAVVDRRWSRDPFVCLGAIAASTQQVDLGVLVANMRNRHPAQLASAVNSLQSLAPGRVRLGIGSGAVPDSRFAAEHEAIGTDLADAAGRRGQLVDSITALRSIWSGERNHEVASPARFVGLDGVVDDAGAPPIVVGASAWPTIQVALAHADGVNLRWTSTLLEVLERIGEARDGSFEVSVLGAYDDFAEESEQLDTLTDAGVDRVVLGISAPHDPDALRPAGAARK